MLQIATGRFARDVKLYETRHRFSLFTNSEIYHSPKIETALGLIFPNSLTKCWTVEIMEKLEAETLDGQEEVMIGTGGSEIATDFAMLLSFVLNTTFTTNEARLAELTSTQRPSFGASLSNKYLGRTFDERIYIQDGEIEELKSLFEKVLRLPRKHYKATISSIRRFVLSTHRVSEEPSLAYTLLVMSVEALEQTTTHVSAGWDDIDFKKRMTLDEVLNDLEPTDAQAVRDVILTTEKTKAASKFRQFALGYLRPSYFREETGDVIRPPAMLDLRSMLNLAYKARSSYVHELKEIPLKIRHPHDHAETIWADGQTQLSFAGMARLVRHVIRNFIDDAPRMEEEELDYRGDLPNIATVQLHSHYWIWRTNNYNVDTAPARLAAFLGQLVTPDGKITDLSDLMAHIETLAPSITDQSKRRPMTALYFAYNHLMQEHLRRDGWKDFCQRFSSDFSEPSMEKIAIRTVFGEQDSLDIEDGYNVFRKYLKVRHHKNVMRLSHVIEAAILLRFAEERRSNGKKLEAQYFVSEAVETLPGNQALLTLELDDIWPNGNPIPWYETLLAQTTQSDDTNGEIT